MPRISVRISDELDAELRAAAERDGVELSDVIRRRLDAGEGAETAGLRNGHRPAPSSAAELAEREGIPLWAAKRRVSGST